MISKFLSEHPRIRKAAMVAMCLGAFATAGCYGSFPLTRLVYKVNGSATNNGVIQSLVLLVLIIIPVYKLCMIIDWLVMNTIEFWSGEKLLVSSTSELPDGSIATLTPRGDGDEAELLIVKGGEVVVRRTYRHVDGARTLVLDENGKILSVVDHNEAGDLTVRSEGGKTLAFYSRADIDAALAAAHAQ